MSAIESHHFRVQLAPQEGAHLHAAVSARGDLPLDRRSFCSEMEANLQPAVELVDGPYHAKGVKDPLAIFRFVANIPAWMALAWTLKQAEEAYRRLVPPSLQRADRRMAKAVKKRSKRQHRYAWRNPRTQWGHASA